MTEKLINTDQKLSLFSIELGNVVNSSDPCVLKFVSLQFSIVATLTAFKNGINSMHGKYMLSLSLYFR